MWDFIVYLGESAISLAVLYLLYKATMSYETLHRLNRVVLLGVVVLAAVLPLCEIKIIEEVELLPLADVEGDVAMMSVVEDTTFDYVAWLKSLAEALFCLGVAFMVVRLVVSQLSVWRMTRSGARRELGEGVVLTVVDKLATPFSWFRNVVVAKSDAEQDLDLILEHELAHVRLHHSWDVLAVDIALCVWWFNPALWLLRRELQSLHEYQADDAVLRKGIDAKTYQILLIKRAVGSRLHSVANCLNHSNLKNRITMMCKKTSSRWSAAKLLLVLPLVALSLAATATTVYVPKEQNKGNENFVETQIVAADGDENSKSNNLYPMTKSELRGYLLQNLQNKQNLVGLIYADVKVLPDGKVVVAKVAPAPGEKDGMQPLVNEVKRVLGNAEITERKPAKEVAYRFEISFGHIEENGEFVWSTIKASDDAIAVLRYVELAADEEQPYIKVQQMPTFQGGDLNAYRNWMQSQLQYPKEAKDKGIKGRVIFSFVVEKDGSVSNFDALQASDKILVDEVERVFKLTPKWEPGKQNGKEVRVKFTVPIVFTGDDVAVYNRVFSQGTPLSEMSKDAESAVGEVSGRVIDAKTKKPIPDVILLINGAGVGTHSDASGCYSLKKLPEGKYTFVASCVGYKSVKKEFEVSSKKSVEVNFELEEQAVAVDEIVVDKNKTAAQSLSNVEKALFEKDNTIVMIDGKEGKIDDIDVDDIESFTVLKGEQATKIYGEKGKNGVMLFTTKKAAQANKQQPAQEAFIKVESMPTFQGGDLNGYRNWVQSQLQYPKEAKDKGVQGRVIFSFVVEEDGSVTSFKGLQAPDKILVDEVERVFKLTPKWEPGKQNGKAVRVKFTVPITFTL